MPRGGSSYALSVGALMRDNNFNQRDNVKVYFMLRRDRMEIFMKFTKRTIMILSMAVIFTLALAGCGGTRSGTESSDSDSSVSGELTERYPDYINSFIEDMGAFMDGDLDKILTGISGLGADNFAEWDELYQSGYESLSHWFSEINTAEMLCPEESKEAHEALIQTVGTIYKIMEGLETRVQAAENGDYSQLLEKESEYNDAAEIAHEMWNRAVEDVQNTLK